MKTKHVESLEEMVFKDRNKQYGAYYLRKQYSNHILISLLIAVFFVGSALTYPLITGHSQKGTQRADTLVVTADPFRKMVEEPASSTCSRKAGKNSRIYCTYSDHRFHRQRFRKTGDVGR